MTMIFEIIYLYKTNKPLKVCIYFNKINKM